MHRRIINMLYFFLFLLFVISCKKGDHSVPDPGDAIPVGVPTPVGTAVGDPVKKTIGSEGGTISSADGRITVNVPAGAINTTHEFSIQPVTNHNPLAVGVAYRLEPHNITFSKPVEIKFTYTEVEVDNTIPEALGIAFQDTAGIWQAQGGASLNKDGRSIKINSSHFSDWSLFESFYMISSATMVHVSGTAELEVFTTEDLVVPLKEGEQVAMGKKVSMAAAYIREWKLAGAGNLHTNGAAAVYKAPSTVPGAPNPVAVSVSIDLKKRGTFLLVRHIEVVEDDGEIEIRVAGNGWVKKTASVAVKMDDGYYVIGDSDGDTQGSYVMIMVPDQLGTHAYRSPDANNGTYVHYLVTGSNNYVCQYMQGEDDLVASGGGVTLTSRGEDDGFLKGTFEIKPAGYGDFLKNTVNIEGRFRVKIATGQKK